MTKEIQNEIKDYYTVGLMEELHDGRKKATQVSNVRRGRKDRQADRNTVAAAVAVAEWQVQALTAVVEV